MILQENRKPTRCLKCEGMLVHTIINSKCTQCGWMLGGDFNVKSRNRLTKEAQISLDEKRDENNNKMEIE